MRNLNKIFNPKSIAVIGATPRKNSVGQGLFKNILEYQTFRKEVEIYPVNPNRKKVLGKKSFPSILNIKEAVDLAIIAVPAVIVPKIIKECCQKKVEGIIVISAGFAETGKEGKILQDEILNRVRKAKIPMIGPNVLGIIRPSIELNTSFTPAIPQKGEIAIVSQSGALIDSIIDRNPLENYGFSTIISSGNEADLETSDFLEWLKLDSQTKVIALYIEEIKDGRKFLKIAKEVSKIKPIVAIKAGKLKTGAKAISSHTGALAGSYEIYKAVFRKAGILEVETIEELLNIAKALAWQPRCKNGIGIVTNGGGCGIVMADHCEDLGIKLKELKKETIKKIEKSGFMNPAWSKRNPVDILGDASPQRFKIAVEALLEQKDIYGLLIIETLQIMTKPVENGKIIIRAAKKYPQKPIICCFLGGKLTAPGIKLLEINRIPNFSELREGALAMKALINL